MKGSPLRVLVFAKASLFGVVGLDDCLSRNRSLLFNYKDLSPASAVFSKVNSSSPHSQLAFNQRSTCLHMHRHATPPGGSGAPWDRMVYFRNPVVGRSMESSLHDTVISCKMH